MRHFLAPIVASPGASFCLQRESSGATIASTLEPAFDTVARKRGLLGRDRLEPGSALVIAPCAAVHTAFMRFPIDLIFAKRDGTILKVCSSVKPWRMAAALGAFAVIEMASGCLAETGVRRGDRLILCHLPDSSPDQNAICA